MSHTNLIIPLFLSLLTVLFAFNPRNAAAALPQLPPAIATPILANLTASSAGSNPPRIEIQIDPMHTIYFTQYRLLVPQRNYFAAIISMQTSLMDEFFDRAGEQQTALLDPGGVSMDVYGAEIYLDNPTGELSYQMAHRVLGELGEFLMEGLRCSARFELWETMEGQAGRRISGGWLRDDGGAQGAV